MSHRSELFLAVCAMSWVQNILRLLAGGIDTSGRHAPSAPSAPSHTGAVEELRPFVMMEFRVYNEMWLLSWKLTENLTYFNLGESFMQCLIFWKRLILMFLEIIEWCGGFDFTNIAQKWSLDMQIYNKKTKFFSLAIKNQVIIWNATSDFASFSAHRYVFFKKSDYLL